MNRSERQTHLDREVRRITELLVDRGASLVLVFGSYARGTIGRASDLDMIAVMASDLPFIRRLERLYDEILPRVGLDLLVYTPEEFESMRHRAFVRHALEEGRILHAA